MLISEFIEIYPQFKNSNAIEYSLCYSKKTIDEEYWFPFREACRTGEVDLIQKFIHLGAVINIENKIYWTALEKASSNGHKKIVKLLLQNGADVHHNNDSALYYAVLWEHTEIIKLLLKCYSPNYLAIKKLHLKINNEILVDYYNYIRKLKIMQKQCIHYLHKPGGPFFLNGLKQLI